MPAMPPLNIVLLLAVVSGCLFQVPEVSTSRSSEESESLDIEDDRAFQVHFTSEALEDLIIREQRRLKGYNVGAEGGVKAVIYHMESAHRLYNKMRRRVLMAREFVEMAIRDNFWDAVTKHFNTSRATIDRRIRKCHRDEDEVALSVFINGMKYEAKNCGDEVIDRTEVNRQEFELLARRMNDIYWKIEGCLGNRLKLKTVHLKHERRRRGFFSAIKSFGKNFITYALPEVAGAATDLALDQIPGVGGSASGGAGGSSPKPCIDREILNNTMLYTQMILYRSYDAIELVREAFGSKSLKRCVTNIVESQSTQKFDELMENCYCPKEKELAETGRKGHW